MFQQQTSTNVQQQQAILQEVSMLWKRLKEHALPHRVWGRWEEVGGEGEEGLGEAVCRGEGHAYGSGGLACISPFSLHVVNFLFT